MAEVMSKEEEANDQLKHWNLQVAEENGKFAKVLNDPESFVHRQEKYVHLVST